jgi:D-3-phosphoglycerate dehydrogenase
MTSPATDPDLPLVLVTEGSDSKPLEWLRRQPVRVVDVRYDGAEFESLLPQAQALVVRTYTKVTEAFLAKAPNLKVVGRGGVGLENIDVKACRARGIEVVYTPDANTIAVGDFVIGYILQLLRPWSFLPPQGYSPDEFKRIRSTLRGRQLDELTIGILGMGRVGRRVGHLANAFGMKVIYNDILDIRPESLPFPARNVDKATLYRDADVLSLHVTMIPGNEHLVGREQLATMKPSSILINTSRGEVLDAEALADAIRAKQLFGAAIDVYWPEPPGPDLPLLNVPNVLLTPHLAARTGPAMENMSWVVRDVVNVLQGHPAKFPAPR